MLLNIRKVLSNHRFLINCTSPSHSYQFGKVNWEIWTNKLRNLKSILEILKNKLRNLKSHWIELVIFKTRPIHSCLAQRSESCGRRGTPSSCSNAFLQKVRPSVRYLNSVFLWFSCLSIFWFCSNWRLVCIGRDWQLC